MTAENEVESETHFSLRIDSRQLDYLMEEAAKKEESMWAKLQQPNNLPPKNNESTPVTTPTTPRLPI